MQFMWFCPTDVTHIWNLNSKIIMVPNKDESMWCVSSGANLDQNEVDILNKGGYILECMEEHDTSFTTPPSSQSTG